MVAQRVAPFSDEIIVGIRGELRNKYETLVAKVQGLPNLSFIEGGSTRQETIGRLLERASFPVVLVHEVTRPLASSSLFETVLADTTESCSVAPFLPFKVRSSLAIQEGDWLGENIPREKVGELQTPQSFGSDLLRESYRRANHEGWLETSTAPLVRNAGFPVKLVPGEETNLKITYPEDLAACRKMGLEVCRI